MEILKNSIKNNKLFLYFCRFRVLCSIFFLLTTQLETFLSRLNIVYFHINYINELWQIDSAKNKSNTGCLEKYLPLFNFYV